MSHAKMAEPIAMPFWIWARLGQGSIIMSGARWRHLLNIIEPSMCGGDAACCHITLTTCLYTW